MLKDNYHDENGVLYNLLNIDDAKLLKSAEYAWVSNIGETVYATHRDKTEIDADSLISIHKMLFEDIYPWAGKLRTVPLFKGGTSFASPDRVNRVWLQGLLKSFHHAMQNPQNDFPYMLGELWGRLNWLHPFPEGNGRATQMFILLIAHRYGKTIDYGNITRTEEISAAMESVTNQFHLYRNLVRRNLRTYQPQTTPAPAFPWIER